MEASTINLTLLALGACFLLSTTLAAPNQARTDKRNVLEWIKRDETSSSQEGEAQQQPHQAACLICGNDFKEFGPLRLKCGHKFHHTCLFGWVHQDDYEDARGCPICTRAALKGDYLGAKSVFYHFNKEFLRGLRNKWGIMARYSLDMFAAKNSMEKHHMT